MSGLQALDPFGAYGHVAPTAVKEAPVEVEPSKPTPEFDPNDPFAQEGLMPVQPQVQPQVQPYAHPHMQQPASYQQSAAYWQQQGGYAPAYYQEQQQGYYASGPYGAAPVQAAGSYSYPYAPPPQPQQPQQQLVQPFPGASAEVSKVTQQLSSFDPFAPPEAAQSPVKDTQFDVLENPPAAKTSLDSAAPLPEPQDLAPLGTESIDSYIYRSEGGEEVKAEDDGLADDDSENDISILELQERKHNEEYEVIFPHEKKLGMLIERHDEWREGSEQRTECAIVKMVVDNGPAFHYGVTVGSILLSVAEESVAGKTYEEILDMLQKAERPLKLRLRRGSAGDDMNSGVCLYKKTVGVPRTMKAWKRRYFVLGGAVAQPHVLQLYTSKSSYDRVVIAIHQKKRIQDVVKAYKLERSYKVSTIKEKQYGGGARLYHFFIKDPNLRMRQINIAAEHCEDLEKLRDQCRQYCVDL